MSIEIRRPVTPKEWENYYDMRYNVLRKPLNQPLGSERNDGDLSGRHFALYDNQILRAIARLDSAGEGISQVRFVAVHPDSQGKGYGRLIMEAVEGSSIKSGNRKMILHARDYALDFYVRLGYNKIEKSYKLYDVLQHYLMEKIY
ncbi:MAG: GNAT family N-acetyltransferase [Crocinitomicaceae bacterium]|nr:GNAT family N-acetyltransferase [Crocinitomicaceae bacterium]